jgi:hypothetical protein
MVDTSALTETERAVFNALNRHGVRYMLVGLERIVVSKRAAGRKKDLAALPALEEALAVLRSEPEFKG